MSLCFAHIFSQSVTCLSVLLAMPFAEKFLTLKFNLPIFFFPWIVVLVFHLKKHQTLETVYIRNGGHTSKLSYSEPKSQLSNLYNNLEKWWPPLSIWGFFLKVLRNKWCTWEKHIKTKKPLPRLPTLTCGHLKIFVIKTMDFGYFYFVVSRAH